MVIKNYTGDVMNLEMAGVKWRRWTISRSRRSSYKAK